MLGSGQVKHCFQLGNMKRLSDKRKDVVCLSSGYILLVFQAVQRLSWFAQGASSIDQNLLLGSNQAQKHVYLKQKSAFVRFPAPQHTCLHLLSWPRLTCLANGTRVLLVALARRGSKASIISPSVFEPLELVGAGKC